MILDTLATAIFTSLPDQLPNTATPHICSDHAVANKRLPLAHHAPPVVLAMSLGTTFASPELIAYASTTTQPAL